MQESESLTSHWNGYPSWNCRERERSGQRIGEIDGQCTALCLLRELLHLTTLSDVSNHVDHVLLLPCALFCQLKTGNYPINWCDFVCFGLCFPCDLTWLLFSSLTFLFLSSFLDCCASLLHKKSREVEVWKYELTGNSKDRKKKKTTEVNLSHSALGKILLICFTNSFHFVDRHLLCLRGIIDLGVVVSEECGATLSSEFPPVDLEVMCKIWNHHWSQ